jgi:hypothetical protein
MALTKYSDVGRPLTVEEVDANWAEIQSFMFSYAGYTPLRSVRASPTDGGKVEFVSDENAVIGTFMMPTPLQNLGAWAPLTAYTTRSVVTHDGTVYWCAAAHTSSSSWSTDLSEGKWAVLAEGVSNTAENVAYDNTDSGLEAETVQAAVDELKTAIDGITDSDDQDAAAVAYDNATSELTADNVQAALDELLARIVALETASA